jgi:hypothetical protein
MEGLHSTNEVEIKQEMMEMQAYMIVYVWYVALTT